MGFFKSLFVFALLGNVSFALNLDFQVNRETSLFYQVFFERSYDNELREEIESSFNSLSSSDDEKAEFIKNLADPKRKYNHKYMTPNFLDLWTKAKEKYDGQFTSDVDILSARSLELKQYSEKTFKKGQLDFDPVFDFYNGQKPREQMKIFVCSTSKSSGNFANAYGNNIILKFNWGKCSADMCEILEQICHRLFQGMRPQDKQWMKNYFLAHKSPNFLPAYFLIDDVLAYTIGKLWAHPKLPAPQDSTFQKTKDPKIEKIAKSILKTIEKYLKDNKKIDKEFLDEFIKQVDRHFPKAYEEYAMMLKRVCIIVENGIDVPECKKTLQSEFEIDEIQDEIGPYTNIFIGKNLGAPALRTIQDKLPRRDGDYIFVTQDPKTRKLYIVINTNDIEKIKATIKDLKRQPAITIGYTKGL